MAIVKMKRLELIGLKTDRDNIMKGLQSLGCVELTAQEYRLDDPEWAGRITLSEQSINEKRKALETVSDAIAALDQYAPVKTPLFAPRQELTESDLFDDKLLEAAMVKATEIDNLEDKIKAASAQKNRITSAKTSLIPWQGLDVPLDMEGTEKVAMRFGVCPVTVDYNSAKAELWEQIPECELYLSSSDREQHYMLLMVLRDKEEEAINLLRRYGWSAASLRGYEGTAKENIAQVDKAAEEYEGRKTELINQLLYNADCREELKLAWERLTQDVAREEAKGELLSTERSFYLQGWACVPALERLEALLAKFDCAFELTDPEPGEDVPIRLQNNALTEPMNMVTEMYSLPSYDGVDPNPLILPFFTIFFGIMYADIGYGLILLIGSFIINKKFKPRGTIGAMMRLATLCGITTAIWGLLFGSCFGDAIPVFTNLIGIGQRELWSLIDPLEQPMVMLVGSLVIGAIHLLCGMAINAVMLIKDGKPLDALFDVGSWWLLFAGIALGAMGKTWLVCIAGALALVLTQGRSKPTIMGKLIGGLAALYDITSYLGDILSYTRLMALLLASSVIASVVNVLGSLSGSVIVFIVVFLIGHAFNMGINIIGTYVHAARLQYLEFFGKFYKDGGRAFAPLSYKTKYTDIIKEEI